MHVGGRMACLLAPLWLGAPSILTAQVTKPAADSLARAAAAFDARLDTLEAGRCPAGPTIAIPAQAAGISGEASSQRTQPMGVIPRDIG